MATRRGALARLAAGIGVLACGRALGQPAEGAAYVAVETSAASGLSRARFVSATGAPLRAVPLDFRAHGLARHGALMAVFPRRPGTRFALVDVETLELRAIEDAPSGRHFYGHGAFAPDGATLAVTENDLETLTGHVGLYEIAPKLRRTGSVPLPRPGPHDIRSVPGGGFQVAMGGLETHPDYGRTPLNLAAFASELAVMDAGGAVTAMGRWPGTEGISLRHLAAGAGGRLYVGGQRADPRRAGPGGVLWLWDGAAARDLDPEDRLRGYVSSVAARGREMVATSKEAALALTYEDDVLVSVERLDGASAAGIGDGGAAVSGYDLLRIGGARLPPPAGHEFDNHGLALG